MGTFSALLAICAGNSPVTSEFPAQRPVTRSFDVFFDLCLNKWLSKQSWDWWFETPLRPLWRHCNGDAVSNAVTRHPLGPGSQNDRTQCKPSAIIRLDRSMLLSRTRGFLAADHSFCSDAFNVHYPTSTQYIWWISVTRQLFVQVAFSRHNGLNPQHQQERHPSRHTCTVIFLMFHGGSPHFDYPSRFP